MGRPWRENDETGFLRFSLRRWTSLRAGRRSRVGGVSCDREPLGREGVTLWRESPREKGSHRDGGSHTVLGSHDVGERDTRRVRHSGVEAPLGDQ